MRPWVRWSVMCGAVLSGHAVSAAGQTTSQIAALAGLAPVASLQGTAAGRAALAANYQVTADIQTGTASQPRLVPFHVEQAQALRDAFITAGDLAELSDGLGTRLGAAYRAHADYSAPKAFTSLSPQMASLVAYTMATVEGDSQAGKFFFANATTDGRTPASPQAAAILSREGGVTDVFGRSYGMPAGSPGADPFGDSRPFQTEKRILAYDGADYFGQPATDTSYQRGPAMNLVRSPSYPSGHTTYGYAGALVLGLLVPERFPEEIARAAEYGNNRIIVGAHYAMDVIAGRTLALYDVAHLLANDPAYVGRTLRRAPVVTDDMAALAAARRTARPVLAAACRGSIAACAASDTGRFADHRADAAFVAATMTYGLPVVSPAMAAPEDVATQAPEATHLLTAAYPWLTAAAAARILTATEGPGGGFLDDGSSFGVYSRLNLFAAAERALALHHAR